MRPLIAAWRALHFAPDQSVDRSWFKFYEPSVYGGRNSIDMMDTHLPSASFDLILSNHVLEHVPDEAKALAESIRVVGERGVVHVCVPSPMFRWETLDWAFADPAKNQHYRDYGADGALHLSKLIQGTHAIAVVGTDDITSQRDIIYFFSRSNRTLESMAIALQAANIAVVRVN